MCSVIQSCAPCIFTILFDTLANKTVTNCLDQNNQNNKNCNCGKRRFTFNMCHVSSICPVVALITVKRSENDLKSFKASITSNEITFIIMAMGNKIIEINISWCNVLWISFNEITINYLKSSS